MYRYWYYKYFRGFWEYWGGVKLAEVGRYIQPTLLAGYWISCWLVVCGCCNFTDRHFILSTWWGLRRISMVMVMVSCVSDEGNQALQQFLMSCNPKQQHSTALESYLIKPIQRILKYPLLLTQLKVSSIQYCQAIDTQYVNSQSQSQASLHLTLKHLT